MFSAVALELIRSPSSSTDADAAWCTALSPFRSEKLHCDTRHCKIGRAHMLVCVGDTQHREREWNWWHRSHIISLSKGDIECATHHRLQFIGTAGIYMLINPLSNHISRIAAPQWDERAARSQVYKRADSSMKQLWRTSSLYLCDTRPPHMCTCTFFSPTGLETSSQHSIFNIALSGIHDKHSICGSAVTLLFTPPGVAWRVSQQYLPDECSMPFESNREHICIICIQKWEAYCYLLEMENVKWHFSEY